MENAIIEDLDDKAILALLLGAIRADRFCEGILKAFIKDGAIFNWLTRLKEIDEKG